MYANTHEIAGIVQSLLENSSTKKKKLTEAEKLVISSVIEKNTYREVSIQHKYKESSLQSAASRLFKELSPIVGKAINRQNFMELIQGGIQPNSEASKKDAHVIDHVKASLWILDEVAQIVSISSGERHRVDISKYLVHHSKNFAATFYLNVSNESLGLLQQLCNTLQIPNAGFRSNEQSLLRSIRDFLSRHSVLLILRFNHSFAGIDWSEYARRLAVLGLHRGQGRLLVFDDDLSNNEIEVRSSLAYQLQLAISLLTDQSELMTPRLIAVNNDTQVISDFLQNYLK
jgi:hypothetical protein